jgi:hypothetical protein
MDVNNLAEMLMTAAASYDTIILINYTCIAEVWQAKQSEIV